MMDYQTELHRICDLLRRSKMDHGLCKPVDRNACTACVAQRKLDEVANTYKGKYLRIVLA